ncbi:glutamate receptor [Trichonephila clavata]|uniref:Glutamate receptor n=1 Tax=Trichonephila clavata TaxID=2740835 RepID=A0A8X6L4W6_TRICU|nr:glutamate receptor [Trichonephila clavata]
MHFRVAVAEYLPFLKLEMQNGNVIMTGPLAEAFELLAQRVNFTYTLHRGANDIWGIKGSNGWTGMLGMVSRNEVDFALGPFTLTYSRFSDFKLSAPMYVDDVEILVPVFEWKLSLFNMLAIFDYQVWIVLFLSIILLCLMLGIIEKCDNPDVPFQMGFLKNLWNFTRTLLQKGKLQRPQGYTRTLLTVSWMMSAFVMSLTFSGLVLTNLLLRKAPKIDSIQDLVTDSDVQPVVEFQSSIYGAFRDGGSEISHKVFKKINRNPTQCILSFKNMSTTGMDLVYSRSFALITDGMGLKHFLYQRVQNHLPCNFRFAKQPLWLLKKVIAFQQTFPDELIHRINHV